MPTADAPDHALFEQWRSRLTAIAAAEAGEDGAHDLNHLHRVWSAARVLLRAHPEADALTVLAACYLHDLVNLPKNHPQRERASAMAAALARERLSASGFPTGRLDGVAHAIEAHSYSAGIPTRTIEARIVQDADRLDALGPIGLARLFYTAGRMGSALAHADDPLACSRPLDDRAFALDHIDVKLATLPASMQTEAGRRLAAERLDWLKDFQQRFALDWAGDLTGQNRP